MLKCRGEVKAFASMMPMPKSQLCVERRALHRPVHGLCEIPSSMSRAWRYRRGSFFTTTAPCVVLLDIAQHHLRKGNCQNFFKSVD